MFSLDRKFKDLKNYNEEVDVDSDKDCDIVEMVIEEPKEKWDCESILSRYPGILWKSGSINLY